MQGGRSARSLLTSYTVLALSAFGCTQKGASHRIVSAGSGQGLREELFLSPPRLRRFASLSSSSDSLSVLKQTAQQELLFSDASTQMGAGDRLLGKEEVVWDFLMRLPRKRFCCRERDGERAEPSARHAQQKKNIDREREREVVFQMSGTCNLSLASQRILSRTPSKSGASAALAAELALGVCGACEGRKFAEQLRAFLRPGHATNAETLHSFWPRARRGLLESSAKLCQALQKVTFCLTTSDSPRAGRPPCPKCSWRSRGGGARCVLNLWALGGGGEEVVCSRPSCARSHVFYLHARGTR